MAHQSSLRELAALLRLVMGVMLISASDASFPMYAQSAVVDGTVPAQTVACAGLRGKLIESVPFQIVHGLPVISVQGKHHQAALFLLDSGSEKSFLNTNDVSRLGFKMAPVTRKQTFTGIAAVTEVSSEAKAIKVFVGKHYEIRGHALTMDLSELNHVLGVELSGTIGYDILRTRPMALDYKNRRFLIYKKISAPEEDVFLSERIDPSKPVAIVASSLVIAGKFQGEVKFEIDTGSETGTLVGNTYSDSHELAKIEGWKKHGSMGFNGSMIGLGGMPGSITLEGQTISIPSVVLSAKGAPAMVGYDISVGYPVFADRCLLFDTPKGVVYLSRSPADDREVVPHIESPR